MPDAASRESSLGLTKRRVDLRAYEAAWSDLGEAERATVVALWGAAWALCISDSVSLRPCSVIHGVWNTVVTAEVTGFSLN